MSIAKALAKAAKVKGLKKLAKPKALKKLVQPKALKKVVKPLKKCAKGVCKACADCCP